MEKYRTGRYRKRRNLTSAERARHILMLRAFVPKNKTEERDKKLLTYFIEDGLSTGEIYDKHDPQLICLGNRARGQPLSIPYMSVIIKKYIPQAAYQDWGKKHKTEQEKIRLEHAINKDRGMTCQHIKQCAFCGSTDNLEEHHMIPVRMLGTNDQRNLVYLCHDCHWDVTRYQRELFKQLEAAGN